MKPRPEPQAMITGPGRSGTGYIAAVLNSAGLRAGHESWWGLGERVEGLDVDCSWLGCYDLGYDGPVYAQVRDPATCIPSIAAYEHRHPWTVIRRQNVMLCGDPAVDACLVWLEYTRMALERAEAWWRVEDVTADDLAWSGVDCSAGLARMPRDINARARRLFKWPDDPVVDEVRALARDLGYADL